MKCQEHIVEDYRTYLGHEEAAAEYLSAILWDEKGFYSDMGPFLSIKSGMNRKYTPAFARAPRCK